MTKSSPKVDPSAVERFAAQKYTRTKADGTVVEWRQEDESAVTTRAEAIAVVQRCIDFWLPKMVDDLVAIRGMSREQAIPLAIKHFRSSSEQLVDEPFPNKWQITLDDLNFSTPELLDGFVK